MRDLDILVSPGELQSAREALAKYGFRPVGPHHPENHHHDPALMRQGEVAALELHYAVLDEPAAKALSVTEAFERSVPLPGDIPARILSPTDRLLHNVLHSEVQDYNARKGTASLRALADFAALGVHHAKEADWSFVRNTLTEAGFGHLLDRYLYLVEKVVGVTIPCRKRARFQSFAHYQRCMLQLRWPKSTAAFVLLDANLEEFREGPIRQRYGHDSRSSYARARHAAYLGCRLWGRLWDRDK